MYARLRMIILVVTAILMLAACAGESTPDEVTRVITDTLSDTEEVDATRATVQTETDTEQNETVVEVETLPPVDPLSVSGNIAIAGSSTVFPLAERMAERFEDEGYSGEITIDSIGSGAGIERFCIDTASDIANASRPIRDSEIESCKSNARTPIEFRVGTDALAVVTSQQNDFLTDVTLEELAAIFGEAETWADVRAEWPDEPIQRFIPGTDSGTFDYFVEVVFDEDREPILSIADANSSTTQMSEDDNFLVQGVQGSPYAVAFFGYAYFQENQDVLKILSIEGVEAIKENVDNDLYPLGRPLFMYSTAGIMAEKPQVAAFLNFVLTNVNDEIVDVGYFPAAEDVLNAAKGAWLNANN